MTHDPEAAERLAAWLLSEADMIRRDFSYAPLTTEPMVRAAALVRAQAAEIAAHPAALQEARNAALRQAAARVETTIQAAREEQEPPVNFLRAQIALRDSILTLIDTPAPPAEPAGLREALEYGLAMMKADFVTGTWKVASQIFVEKAEAALAALAAAPAPIQPAPQPDPDEREAMIAVIYDAMDFDQDDSRAMAVDIADALRAAGCRMPRKRGEG